MKQNISQFTFLTRTCLYVCIGLIKSCLTLKYMRVSLTANKSHTIIKFQTINVSLHVLVLRLYWF